MMTLKYFCFFFFFSSRRRHTRCSRDWSSDVCSSDLFPPWCRPQGCRELELICIGHRLETRAVRVTSWLEDRDRKSTRLNSSHGYISYAVFCLKKKNKRLYLYQSSPTHQSVYSHNNVVLTVT